MAFICNIFKVFKLKDCLFAIQKVGLTFLSLQVMKNVRRDQKNVLPQNKNRKEFLRRGNPRVFNQFL